MKCSLMRSMTMAGVIYLCSLALPLTQAEADPPTFDILCVTVSPNPGLPGMPFLVQTGFTDMSVSYIPTLSALCRGLGYIVLVSPHE